MFETQESVTTPVHTSSGHLTGSIVPFSHVQNDFPQIAYSPNGTISDFGIQLPSTPHKDSSEKEKCPKLIDENGSRTEEHTPKNKDERTEKYSVGESKTVHSRCYTVDRQTLKNISQDTAKANEEMSSKDNSWGTKKGGIKRKVVGQLTQDNLTSINSPSVSQVSETRSGENHGDNRSRPDQKSEGREVLKGILKGSASSLEGSLRKVASMKTPERTRNKRAKRYGTSVAESLSLMGTPTVSEYFNNTASPTVSASGSQRSKRRGHEHCPTTVRNTTRGRRRSRGNPSHFG
jgi:hypothetical protein